MANDIAIVLQNPAEFNNIPTEDDWQRWLQATLVHLRFVLEEEIRELTVRVVSMDDIQLLNKQFRDKDRPTNILSFHYDPMPGMPNDSLGDLVLCADIIIQEAEEQNKPVIAHWAHLMVHGILHLLGFDHMSDSEALIMESMETEILAELGYPDPYRPDNDPNNDLDTTTEAIHDR